MTVPLLVAVETGGTKTLCRVVQGERVLTETRLPTVTPERTVDTLIGAVEAARPKGAEIAGIGLASFGPIVVDPASDAFGTLQATNKAGWSGFNLGQTLSERLNAPVAIDTDVNAAALAEQGLGAGRGAATLAYVTIGTGIGGGLAMRGQTLKGALHPEIGHLPVRRRPDDDQPSLCRFHAACAEGLAAGPAVQARLRDGQTLETRPQVRSMVADYLGQLCATLVLAWSPERIVLGGGVMSAAGLLPEIAERLAVELNNYGAGGVTDRPDYLVLAELEHAGLEGALLMAREIVAKGVTP